MPGMTSPKMRYLIGAAILFVGFAAMGAADIVLFGVAQTIGWLISTGVMLFLVIGLSAFMVWLLFAGQQKRFMKVLATLIAGLSLTGAIDGLPGTLFYLAHSPPVFLLVAVIAVTILIMAARGWRKWKWELAVIVLFPLFHAYGPTWPDDPRDDSCSFGSVPNSKYQEFLQIAQDKIATGEWAPIKIWPWLPTGNKWGLDIEAEQLFRQRLEKIMALAHTDNERIAAIHAAARAMGGRYDPRSVTRSNYSFFRRERVAGMSYRVDSRQLGNYFPLTRWDTFNVGLTMPPIRLNGINFGGVSGWDYGSPMLDSLFIAIPPPRHLCPPFLPETSSQNRSQP